MVPAVLRSSAWWTVIFLVSGAVFAQDVVEHWS